MTARIALPDGCELIEAGALCSEHIGETIRFRQWTEHWRTEAFDRSELPGPVAEAVIAYERSVAETPSGGLGGM